MGGEGEAGGQEYMSSHACIVYTIGRGLGEGQEGGRAGGWEVGGWEWVGGRGEK